MSEPTEEDAWRCAQTFMKAVDALAEGDSEASAQTLQDYITTDEATAERNAWSLVSVAPMITAQAMRRHFAGQVPADGLWTIGSIADAGVPIEQVAEPNGLAAARAVVQHLNVPLGEGAGPAMDVTIAHFHEHGPDGVMGMIVEMVQLAAFLWKDGAFELRDAPKED